MLRALLGLLIGGLIAGTGYAENYTVAVDENLAPYSYRAADGKVVGIDIDMLQELGRRLNIQFTPKPLPWKRVLAETQIGRSQLSMPLFRTPERETFALFTGVMHYSRLALFGRRNQPWRPVKLEDLRGKNIGVNRGFVLQPAFDKAAQEGLFQIEEVNTLDQNVRKLLAGRIDAFAANEDAIRFTVRGTPAASEIVMQPLVLDPSRPAFLVISRAARLPREAELAQRLKTTLDAMHRDGSYRRIVARHLN